MAEAPGPLRRPGLHDRVDRAGELGEGVGQDLVQPGAEAERAEDVLRALRDLPHGLPGQLLLVPDAVLLLGGLDQTERLEVHTPGRRGVGGEEPTVGIVGPPGPVLGEGLRDLVVHADEHDGREDAGHGQGGAAPDRQDQRVVPIAEAPGGTGPRRDVPLEDLQMPCDLAAQASGLAPVHAGPREARGKDEPVTRRQIEVADVEETASLGPVPLAQARAPAFLGDPPGDLLPMGEMEDGVIRCPGLAVARARSMRRAPGQPVAKDGGGEIRELHHAVQVVQVPLHVGEDQAQVVRLQRQPIHQLLVGDGHPLADPVVDALDAVQHVDELGVGLRGITEDGDQIRQIARLQPVVPEVERRQADDLQALRDVHLVLLVAGRHVPEGQIAHLFQQALDLAQVVALLLEAAAIDHGHEGASEVAGSLEGLEVALAAKGGDDVLERPEHRRLVLLPEPTDERGDRLRELARGPGGVEALDVRLAGQRRLDPGPQLRADAYGMREALRLGGQDPQMVIVDPAVPPADSLDQDPLQLGVDRAPEVAPPERVGVALLPLLDPGDDLGRPQEPPQIVHHALEDLHQSGASARRRVRLRRGAESKTDEGLGGPGGEIRVIGLRDQEGPPAEGVVARPAQLVDDVAARDVSLREVDGIGPQPIDQVRLADQRRQVPDDETGEEQQAAPDGAVEEAIELSRELADLGLQVLGAEEVLRGEIAEPGREASEQEHRLVAVRGAVDALEQGGRVADAGDLVSRRPLGVEEIERAFKIHGRAGGAGQAQHEAVRHDRAGRKPALDGRGGGAAADDVEVDDPIDEVRRDQEVVRTKETVVDEAERAIEPGQAPLRGEVEPDRPGGIRLRAGHEGRVEVAIQACEHRLVVLGQQALRCRPSALRARGEGSRGLARGVRARARRRRRLASRLDIEAGGGAQHGVQRPALALDPPGHVAERLDIVGESAPPQRDPV